MLSSTATQHGERDAGEKKCRFCARSRHGPPMMYALMEALARSRPGK